MENIKNQRHFSTFFLHFCNYLGLFAGFEVATYTIAPKRSAITIPITQCSGPVCGTVISVGTGSGSGIIGGGVPAHEVKSTHSL